VRSKFLGVFALTVLVLALAAPLSGHHGNAAYDVSKQVTLKGTVTEWFWGNPHCLIQFDVNDDSGQVVHWTAETENPSTMTHMGWSRFSFKPGDAFTITVYPVKNGKPIGRIISVVTAGGQKLPGRILPVIDSSKPEGN
jgi:hypothetical protein